MNCRLIIPERKRRIVSVVVQVFCLIFSKSAWAQSSADAVFLKNQMAVVLVRMQASIADQPERKGSGFIINSDGDVITANHVLAGYVDDQTTPISVLIGSEDGIPPTPIYATPTVRNNTTDIAVLHLRSPASFGLSSYHPVAHAAYTGTLMSYWTIGFPLTGNIATIPITLQNNMGGGGCGNADRTFTAPGVLFGSSGAPVFDLNGNVNGMIRSGVPGAYTCIVTINTISFSVSLTQWFNQKAVLQLSVPVLGPPKLDVSGLGPIFTNPMLNDRTLDGCTLPGAPDACMGPALMKIAGAFCEEAGFASASATDPPQAVDTKMFHRSYKLSIALAPDGHLASFWNIDNGGGYVITRIVCE